MIEKVSITASEINNGIALSVNNVFGVVELIQDPETHNLIVRVYNDPEDDGVASHEIILDNVMRDVQE